MNTPRETVSVALYSLFTPLVSSTGVPVTGRPFVYSSRLFPSKATIESNPQPALYLIESDENDDETQVYSAQRYLLRYKLCIFAQTPSDNVTPPGAVLNPLLDAIDGAMGKTPNGAPVVDKQTLSNYNQPPLVANAWVNGKVSKSYAELTQQNFVIVPIAVVTGQ